MSITRLDNKKYLIRFTGYYTDGTRNYVRETFYGTLREAEVRESELMKENGSRKVTKSDFTVSEFLLDVYLPLKKESTAPETYKHYETYCMKYLCPWLGNIKLKSLNGSMLDRAFTKLKTGTSYKIYQCLRSAMNIAVRYRYITENPIDFMITPPRQKKGARSRMRAYSVDEVVEVLEHVRGEWFEALWLLCVFGGLRPQEACAMKTQRANWDGNLLVDRAIGRGDEIRWAEKSTKTDNARVVSFGSTVASRIIELSKDRIGYIAQKPGSAYAFTTPDAFGRAYRRFCERNSLPYIAVKDLRHTCATQMRAAGADFKDIQQVLGHSKLSTTLDNYMEELAPSTVAATHNWAAKIDQITCIKNKKYRIK